MSKPKVFIGSSSEGLRIAEAVYKKLESETTPYLWNNDCFAPGDYPLYALVEAFRNSDYAIFVATPDDPLIKKGQSFYSIRDNVIFEFGLAIGLLGHKNVYLLLPSIEDSNYPYSKEMSTPSDLDGITFISYDYSRISRSSNSQQEILGAVQSACTDIKEAIRKNPKQITANNEASDTIFHRLSEIVKIKNQALDFINSLDQFTKRNKVYNVLEALHILSNFSDENINSIIEKSLDRFIRDDFEDSKRFNLIRHFRFLPDLCDKLSASSLDANCSKWLKLKEKILFLIIASQNDNGSWGYYPRKFSTKGINRSDLCQSWALTKDSEKEKIGRLLDGMNSYYASLEGETIDSKSSDSNIWTAYSLLVLRNEKNLSPDKVQHGGIIYLINAENKNGGWGFNYGQTSNISSTCIVLNALLSYYQSIKSGTLGLNLDIETMEDIIIKSLNFIIQEFKKTNRDIDSDEGGGTDLDKSFSFNFSIPSNIIDCFSNVIIECKDLLEKQQILYEEIKKILQTQVNKAILKARQNNLPIWEARITLESLNKLYELYNRKTDFDSLKALSDNLFQIIAAV